MNASTPDPSLSHKKAGNGLREEDLVAAGITVPPSDPRGTVWEPPSPEELSCLIPGYAVIQLLGRGGMGAVYKATQLSLDRSVAIKLLPPSLGADPALKARFQREAKAMARLSHPHIVQIYGSGETINGQHYFVMEYVDGSDLHELVRSGRIDAEGTLIAVGQICKALQYAHDRGFVHRDIKPANILLDCQGMLKIGDFGLAKLITGDNYHAGISMRMGLTAAGIVVGTLNYAAPEQLNSSGNVDHRADLYSLGIMFYEMLTREIPRGAAKPPSRKMTGLDVRIDRVVFKAIDPDPNGRYQTASELQAAVDHIRTTAAPPELPQGAGEDIGPPFGHAGSGEGVEPSQPGIPAEGRTTKSWKLAAGFAGLTMLGGIGLFGFLRREAFNHRPPAEKEAPQDYAAQILPWGITAKADLSEVLGFRKSVKGFAGISRERLTWPQAQDLAWRTGSRIYTMEVGASGGPLPEPAWLTDLYRSCPSASAWISLRGEPRILSETAIEPAADRDSPYHVILQWQPAKSLFTAPAGATIPAPVLPPAPLVPEVLQIQAGRPAVAGNLGIGPVPAGSLTPVVTKASTIPPPPMVPPVDSNVSIGQKIDGKASASYLSFSHSLEALNDNFLPLTSRDGSRPQFSWHPRRASFEWVQFELPQVQMIAGCEVYWCLRDLSSEDDDEGLATGLPEFWRVLYRNEMGEWLPVEGYPLPPSPDSWNVCHFKPVLAKALRLAVQIPSDFTSGLHEWKIIKASADAIVAPPAGELRLDDFIPAEAKVGAFSYRVNKYSQAEEGKGAKILLDGKPCRHFLFTHADSAVKFAPPTGFTRFTALGTGPTVPGTRDYAWAYQVVADGKTIFQSRILNSYPDHQVKIQCDFPPGTKELVLITDGIGSNSDDHSVWANPKLERVLLSAGTKAKLARLESQFEAALNREILSLNRSYVAAVNRTLIASRNEAHVTAVAALEKELKTVPSDGVPAKFSDGETPKVLTGLRATYRKSLLGISTGTSRAVADLLVQYTGELETLAAGLRNNPSEAASVRAVKSSLAAKLKAL